MPCVHTLTHAHIQTHAKSMFFKLSNTYTGDSETRSAHFLNAPLSMAFVLPQPHSLLSKTHKWSRGVANFKMALMNSYYRWHY